MWRLGAVAGDAVGKRDVAVPATKQDFDPAFGEALLREGIETMLMFPIALPSSHFGGALGVPRPLREVSETQCVPASQSAWSMA
jgi:hypothetical protein